MNGVVIGERGIGAVLCLGSVFYEYCHWDWAVGVFYISSFPVSFGALASLCSVSHCAFHCVSFFRGTN